MTKTRALRALAAGVLLCAAMPTAAAQTYSVLHSFTGTDGGDPFAGVIADPAGNLFGTTLGGEAGTVYKLDQTGLTVLYAFTNASDGVGPVSGLLRDAAGNLYGTTSSGGHSGEGTIYKVDPSGTETVLYSFKGGKYGWNPIAALIRDTTGDLYGTTGSGGTANHGTIFKLDKSGQTVLHSFRDKPDGNNPQGTLIQDLPGNLYGATAYGGALGFGAVFKLDTTGHLTILYSFTGFGDGSEPMAGLIEDTSGNFYGTTSLGGTSNAGVVFQLDAAGMEKALYSFTGGTDGANPMAALVRDADGNLYGTTFAGGLASAEQCPSGCGVVFKIDPAGTETVLYSFTGGADGANPTAGLLRDTAGNLYGTATRGGASNNGVVFKIAP